MKTHLKLPKQMQGLKNSLGLLISEKAVPKFISLEEVLSSSQPGACHRRKGIVSLQGFLQKENPETKKVFPKKLRC